MRILRVTRLTLLALILLCWASTESVKAHGDDSMVQLYSQPTGDYLLTVLTSPASPHVGPLHIAVMVNDAQTNQPLLGKPVLIRVTPLDIEGATLSSWALSSTTLLSAYESHLLLPKAGHYRVTVSVVEANQTMHPVSFDLYARSVLLMQGLILVLFAQALVVAIWLMKEGWLVWGRRLNDYSRLSAPPMT
jgi:hypothetical protein